MLLKHRIKKKYKILKKRMRVYFDLLFKSTHYNYNARIVQDRRGEYDYITHFKTIEALKKYQKKLRRVSFGVGSMVLTTVVATLVLSIATGPVEQTSAVTYNWDQSIWSGGMSVLDASHSTNQTNWDKYESKDTSVDVTTTPGEMKLTATPMSWVTTSDSDFGAGMNEKVGVSGGDVYLLKPDGGAIATSHTECLVNWGKNGLCGGGPGITGPCAGFTVYFEDFGTTMQWKTSLTNCNTPQCGLDGGQNNLVADNAVDFSLYPARDACKAIGGRLPTVTELQCIYNNQASYGNNFQNTYYWSSTENSSTNARSVNFTDGFTSYGNKTNTYSVRCVRGW